MIHIIKHRKDSHLSFISGSTYKYTVLYRNFRSSVLGYDKRDKEFF